MALYHRWDVKNGFTFALQVFSLISDGLGGVKGLQTRSCFAVCSLLVNLSWYFWKFIVHSFKTKLYPCILSLAKTFHIIYRLKWFEEKFPNLLNVFLTNCYLIVICFVFVFRIHGFWRDENCWWLRFVWDLYHATNGSIKLAWNPL